ncbi:ATP-binding protein [Dyadobacter sp. CY351]|uniref:ATP-binding protein n=1 Tax=Dyadobacter sp. CY351 TaxID=2909337 RepID=UPI001F26697F|nr:ATP-binding protein [Dyadobacter sp. CY351]MCF2520600.1 ATP-binding protein [Dyadobacter sp. CY351]
MIKRILEETVKTALTRNASVALMGPRQVGKTTLALDLTETLPSVYLDLESRLDLIRIDDVRIFHLANEGKLIVLDEVQRIPEIFSEIRGIIDQERRKGNRYGQFLFLGSASMDLLQRSGESLAGRISYLELFPINVLEYAEDDQEKLNMLWVRGGFPESLLAESDQASFEWRLNFIKTYLERDIPMLGPRIPAAALERFWTMLTHNQGSVFNASHLARNLDVSSVTIARYLDLMTDLLLVRRLKPWTFNTGKRLIRSPKVYVRDSGITHALLNIENHNNLLGHPVVGMSWEGFVIENIMSILHTRAQAYYYGSPGGAEIDLVLEFGNGENWAIEIKKSFYPKLSKGFHVACEDLKPERKFVIYSGNDTFFLGEDIMAISISAFMKLVSKKS